ncbi:MAG TPA: M14 family zinc carboxypeptidase, partial [Oscillospiraceae bacterium]|nr:M14 family zinc carboxypeptidase [Oscillospiraceae bacterium]
LYPSLVSVSTVGNSVNGRAIKLIKLGKGNKKALILGAIHAREIITSKYLMLCVFEFCEAYNSKSGKYGDYNVKKLLNEYTLYIVPCTNPDGMEIVSNSKVPNAYIADFSRHSYKANTNGVDLNRNFPLAWELIRNEVTGPSNAAYKGPAAGSEPETQCIMSLCKDNRFKFALSFHITGECIFWGDTYDTSHNNNYKRFTKKLTDLTDFYLTPESSDVNSYGGGFENWFRHEYKKPGLCVELVSYKYTTSPTDNTDYKDFDKTVNWGVSKYIILEAMS